MHIFVVSLFFLLLTYFIINIYSNKGIMGDTEFLITFVFLLYILWYVYYQHDTEGFQQENKEMLRERVRKSFFKFKKRIEKALPQLHKKMLVKKDTIVDYLKTHYPKLKNFLHNHKAWI